MNRNLPYSRADRVAKEVYHLAAEYFYKKIDDERLSGLQITKATMTKDLSIARIYFYIDGGKDRREAAKKALDKIKADVRHTIGREIVLKSVPTVEFHIDEGVENAERIGEILKRL